MEIPLPLDPLFDRHEEWWNEFPIELELTSLTQLSLEAISGSAEYTPYNPAPLTSHEMIEQEEFYSSSSESPSAVL